MESYTFQVWISVVQQLRNVSKNSRLAVLFSFADFQRQTIHPNPAPTSISLNPDSTISSVRFEDGRSCTVDVPTGTKFSPPSSFDLWLVDDSTGRSLVVGTAKVPFPASAPSGVLAEMPHSLYDNTGQVVGSILLSSKWAKLASAPVQQEQPQPIPAATPQPTSAPPSNASQQGGTPGKAAPPVGNAKGKGIVGSNTVVTTTTTTGGTPAQPPSKTYVLKVNMDSKASRKQEEEDKVKKRTDVARRKTLLHLLQYDVAYQLKSASNHLSVILEREHGKLNEVAAPTTQPPLSRLSINVNHIIRLMNIAVQICEDLVGERTSSLGETSGANKLPIPKVGSVAYFLHYEVLYQLQCLAAHLSFVISHHRSRIEVRVSSLHKQHRKFMRLLVTEVSQLTRSVNVVVQSTLDGNLGSKEALKDAEEQDYSSDSSSSKDGYSSDDSVESLVEEVVSSKPLPAPAVVQPVVQKTAAPAPATTTVTTAPRPTTVPTASGVTPVASSGAAAAPQPVSAKTVTPVVATTAPPAAPVAAQPMATHVSQSGQPSAAPVSNPTIAGGTTTTTSAASPPRPAPIVIGGGAGPASAATVGNAQAAAPIVAQPAPAAVPPQQPAAQASLATGIQPAPATAGFVAFASPDAPAPAPTPAPTAAPQGVVPITAGVGAVGGVTQQPPQPQPTQQQQQLQYPPQSVVNITTQPAIGTGAQGGVVGAQQAIAQPITGAAAAGSLGTQQQQPHYPVRI